ncbi:MAG TPA: STAS domain-containing protein [Phycisphaerales bacterium]|nr:STAS domain-containing protein [Phycisphaerales bacterium]
MSGYAPGMMAEQGQSLFVTVGAGGPGQMIVKLVGPAIGQREVPIIGERVVGELERFSGLKMLVLDMSSVTFMNSMGLGMCIDFRNRAAKSGAKAAIVGANAELTGLFKMVKLEKLYTFAKTVGELS